MSDRMTRCVAMKCWWLGFKVNDPKKILHQSKGRRLKRGEGHGGHALGNWWVVQ